MADIVAQQAAAASPQVYLWAGGMFDMMLAGLPIYFWIIFMGMLMLGGMIFWHWYTWNLCTAVAGYYDAIRKNTPLALKITKNMKMKLVPAKYADQIFEWEDPNEIEKWYLSSLTAVGQLGSVNTAILVDFHDWVENPLINESIKVSAEMWNRLYPDDQIHHFSKYALYREQGKIQAAVNKMNEEWNRLYPDEPKIPNDFIRVPSYFLVAMNEQETYLPKDNDASGTGGWMIHESYDYKTPDNEEKKNYGTYILAGCVTVGILILIFSWLTGQNM